MQSIEFSYAPVLIFTLHLKKCIGLPCSEEDRKEGPVAKEEADLLTVSEVADHLRVDDTTVRRWIKNGVLDAIKLPHTGARQAYRVRRTTLEALLSAPPESLD